MPDDMIEMHSTKLPDGFYNCPFCENSSSLTRFRDINVVKLLFWKLKEEVVDEFVKCANCNKRTPFSALKKNTGSNVHVAIKDGVKTKVVQNLYDNKNNLKYRVETRILTNYSQYIPVTENKDLYITTLLLICKYVLLKDPTITDKNKDFYLGLLDNYKDLAAKLESEIIKDNTNVEEIEALSKEYFNKCHSEFTNNVSMKLLENSLLLLAGKFFIVKEIEDYYYAFLKLIKVNDLEKQRVLLSLIKTS